ncbi:hypothetical protein A0U40_13350 [[Bacillus] sp. KCTC 13219]|nr:hypothetical protein A0U40_13350 [[Bacillus] sp. KCTC 13219]
MRYSAKMYFDKENYVLVDLDARDEKTARKEAISLIFNNTITITENGVDITYILKNVRFFELLS